MSYATPRSALPSPKAGGNIAVYRFLEVATGADFTVTQANAATDRVLGVSTGVERAPAGFVGSTADRAAIAGDIVDYIGWGEVALLEVGSGGLTRFQGVVPGANGAGVAVSSNAGATFAAIALEAGAEGAIIRVYVCPPTQLNVA